MCVDPTGHSPKWWQWLLFGIGAALVVGAVTVLTMGVGTSIMATTMAGTVIHGAAVGTLIGAGIGAGLGAVIGGATSDWSVEGILEGAMTGFGVGAFVGAIAGGSVGAIQYTNAANSWLGGKEKMIDHYMKHGLDMKYKNVVDYTKAAKRVIANGKYITSKNAYSIFIKGNKYLFAGVGKGTKLITTFSYRTFTKSTALLLGLI